MNELAIRLKTIRVRANLSRKDVEKLSAGDIKASSLSTFENAQSLISISYLRRIIDFYSSQGIDVSYDWLFTGYGIAPEEKSILSSNLSSIKESDFFKYSNENSIIITVDNESLEPLVSIGDLIGAVRVKMDFNGTKLCVINTNKGLIVKPAKVINNGVVILDLNTKEMVFFDKDHIIDLYRVIWIRGNL